MKAARCFHFALVVVRIWTLVARLKVPLVFRPAAVISRLILGLVPTALLLMREAVAQSRGEGVRGLAFLGAALLGKCIRLVTHSAALDMLVSLHIHEGFRVRHHLSGQVAAVFALRRYQHSFARVRFTAQVQGFIA